MFLLGHSHIVQLEGAADALGVPYDSLNLWGFGARPVLYDQAAPRLNPDLAWRLGEFVVSAVGGSAHDMIGLAQHPRPFDFVLPERPGLPLIDGAEIVPAEAVSAAIRLKMEDEQLDLVRLLAGPGRRALHVESPPPSAPDARLAQEMGMMPYAAEPHLGPSPVWLRYKLWRLHSAIVRQACEAAGVEFLAHPQAALVDGCYLRPELYHRPCHANAAYGELVFGQLGFGP
jgi:hypothetical protein